MFKSLLAAELDIGQDWGAEALNCCLPEHEEPVWRSCLHCSASLDSCCCWNKKAINDMSRSITNSPYKTKDSISKAEPVNRKHNTMRYPHYFSIVILCKPRE